MNERYGDSTRTVKAVDSEAIPGQPVPNIPVPASTFHLSPDEGAEDHIYGRYSNPVWLRLEAALAQFEEAAGALSFGSGMAAVTAALRVLCRPGQVLVIPADGYYQVRRYARECLVPLGITVVEANAGEICDAAAGADVVLAETPTNPALDVVDLHRLAGICHRRGARLVVDNTTATPFGQQPLSLGADLVVASATKSLAGHSDLLAGYVAGSHPDLMAAVETERTLAGPILGAFDAWLLLRSIGTFGLRFDRQCQNALALATALQGHPRVRSVSYPGIPGGPSHAVAAAQMRRFGGVLSIELDGGSAAVHDMVARSDLLVAATSFGGLHTSVDRRARWGDAVPDGFVRISAGIEDTDDLVADVVAALDAAGL
ncbi:MAG: cystathionine gamma-lyase [Mycobacterium sp.]